jgi:hypothetical protein
MDKTYHYVNVPKDQTTGSGQLDDETMYIYKDIFQNNLRHADSNKL